MFELRRRMLIDSPSEYDLYFQATANVTVAINGETIFDNTTGESVITFKKNQSVNLTFKHPQEDKITYPLAIEISGSKGYSSEDHLLSVGAVAEREFKMDQDYTVLIYESSKSYSE